MQTVKIFYRVDLGTFKGTFNKENTSGRYCFVNSKNQEIVTDSLEYFLMEGHPAYLGLLDGDNCDLRRAFDFETHLDLNDAIEHFGIEWSQRVKHLISKITYQLVDSNKGLEIKLDFVNKEDWEQFDRICENESIGHGFQRCKLGVYYDVKQHHCGKYE